MPAIRVLTFDLDNTLWDVGEVIGTAERAMRGYLQQNAPEAVAVFESGRVAEIRERVVALQPELVHNLSALRETIVFETLRDCGFGGDEASRIAGEAFDVFIEARHQVTYFDHALSSLKVLSNRYTMGALSNGNADPNRLGLGHYLTFSFSSERVGMSKPAPDMFHAALEHNGVHPSEAVHIGDHPDDDIAGAAGVGMHTIWVNLAGERYPGQVQPTRQVTSLAELADAVAAIEAL